MALHDGTSLLMKVPNLLSDFDLAELVSGFVHSLIKSSQRTSTGFQAQGGDYIRRPQ
jgi:hypothetical protein